MTTAKQERERAMRGEGCLGKAADDEPVFILRGQDVHAAGLVRDWADLAEGTKCPPEKISEARELARQMQNWRTRKHPD